MTPLHNQVKNLLLPALLKATGEARGSEAKPEYDPAELAAAQASMKVVIKDWGVDYTRKVYDLVQAGFNITPKFPFDVLVDTKPTGRPLVLYSCVKFLGGVYCVSHQIKRFSWSPKLVSTAVPLDKFEIASDEEVETWVDSLTSAALKQILIQNEFAVILEPMFETEEYVSIDQTKPEVGDVVQKGPDWRYDGQGTDRGYIIEGATLTGWARVRWSDGSENDYRMGAEGAYDLTIIEREVTA